MVDALHPTQPAASTNPAPGTEAGASAPAPDDSASDSLRCVETSLYVDAATDLLIQAAGFDDQRAMYDALGDDAAMAYGAARCAAEVAAEVCAARHPRGRGRPSLTPAEATDLVLREYDEAAGIVEDVVRGGLVAMLAVAKEAAR